MRVMDWISRVGYWKILGVVLGGLRKVKDGSIEKKQKASRANLFAGIDLWKRSEKASRKYYLPVTWIKHTAKTR